MRTGFALASVGIVLGSLGCGGSQEEALLPKSEEPTPWFAEITAEVGIEFRHDSGWDGTYFMPEHIGAGGALFDYDGDGDLDLYLIDSGSHTGEQADGTSGANRFFEQQAEGVYVDKTERTGLGDTRYGMGSTVGDYDNDGDLDVFVTNFGLDSLYRNEGDGSFSEVTTAAGLAADRWSVSTCFFDYDRDGNLDLYIATYVHHDPPKVCTDEAGRPEYCGPLAFRGEPDLLYRNRGDGTFADVSNEAGIGLLATRGLGVACLDFDGDDWPDVYVANDGEKNELWVNQRDGTFEDQSVLLGVGVNMAGQAEASMGVATGDVDGDLDLDIFLSHLDRESNTLYLNLGEGGFMDSTAAWRLGPDSLPFTGFGTAFFDVEQDGDLDLIIANGRVRRGQGKDWTEGAGDAAEDVAAHWRPYAEPNLLLVNEDTGRFRNVSSDTGALGRRIEVSRSVLLGDLDRDGDSDVVLTQCDGPTRVYRNELPEPGHWVRIRIAQPAANRRGVGSRLELEIGGRKQMAFVTSVHSYLASVEPEVHFGLGSANEIDRLTVRWPSGPEQAILALPADRRIHLYRNEASEP